MTARIQWLFIAAAFVAVDFTLTVVHEAKGKKPVVFVHNVSMQMISARPIPPEINVQFHAV